RIRARLRRARRGARGRPARPALAGGDHGLPVLRDRSAGRRGRADGLRSGPLERNRARRRALTTMCDFHDHESLPHLEHDEYMLDTPFVRDLVAEVRRLIERADSATAACEAI